MYLPDEANIGPGEAVAIIGAALRFPGASDPSSFHDVTVAGRRMFRELTYQTDSSGPADRGKRRQRSRAGRPMRLAAALLDDATPEFGADDALANGITARHVLAAEIAAAALADVPPAGRAVPAERIGVFIADIPDPGTADVRDWVKRHLGILATALVNRPNPDALPCSLRAVTAACEALNAGEFDLVLAGGVAKGVGGWMRGHAANTRADGHVRVYDASPSGSLPGEGCGIVVLTRAADAQRAEVPAYAEIAGWHHADPATPQRAVLPGAYLRAGIDPAAIQFIEGHGAATATETWPSSAHCSRCSARTGTPATAARSAQSPLISATRGRRPASRRCSRPRSP
jgi:acyl transferase domain-containing protein